MMNSQQAANLFLISIKEDGLLKQIDNLIDAGAKKGELNCKLDLESQMGEPILLYLTKYLRFNVYTSSKKRDEKIIWEYTISWEHELTNLSS